LLIIVAGISALLVSLTLTFLVSMRSDVEESEGVIREAQARLVLIAALQYLQEASRLGYDDPATPEHEEAFGWSDIRDGSAGPKDKNGRPLYTVGNNRFPDIGGTAARFQLHALEQPPFAIATQFAPNPTPTIPYTSGTPAVPTWPTLVKYENPDPKPASDTWIDFAKGKPEVRSESQMRSWFRLYRNKNPTDPTKPPMEPATFTITCGAGATQGFRDYQEAFDLGYAAIFNHDPKYFATLRAQERILWFRTEWTSAVGGSSMGIRIQDGYWEMPEINQGSYTGSNAAYTTAPLNNAHQQWWANRNALGSFLWIQRLDKMPDHNEW
jgi:hypothetical protein